MSERINPQAASDVAGIALSIPDKMTSGEVLAALHKAWKAGYTSGFEMGYTSGQRQVAEIVEQVYGAMP